MGPSIKRFVCHLVCQDNNNDMDHGCKDGIASRLRRCGNRYMPGKLDWWQPLPVRKMKNQDSLVIDMFLP